MRWVNFDAPHALIGQFADVLITEALSNSLRGRLANIESTGFHTQDTRLMQTGTL
jgi:tRNA-2-methylthio-N6-dimethylallyladenosine synthase